ncbi:alpha-ribazole phosphatase [Burkholderiales bacterium]|nr:MAG: histidine phosphatase family protein [Burkholderiales bacterium]CAG1007509.1 alpha-ribazole phosphatase [Burkholderiales bacterium]
MSLEVDLLRHGDTGAVGFRGRGDDALTALGWQQMREAVAAAGPWALIVSSPLRRCAAFARELASERGLPCEIEPCLAELDFGAWEGKTHEQLLLSDATALRAFWQNPWQHPPTDGESLPAFAARVFGAVDGLARQRPGQKALIVAHGGVLRLLCALAQGLTLDRIGELALPHGALLRLAIEPTETRSPKVWARRKEARN